PRGKLGGYIFRFAHFAFKHRDNRKFSFSAPLLTIPKRMPKILLAPDFGASRQRGALNWCGDRLYEYRCL
ncbi:MAG: hypothetical protein KGL02_10880, partial [Acidobacteriota bacterium]|nr:hypothetical protein [Acidobacteriota bacterium]